ncbi:uncharacterized protein BO66DRAFT_442807 [Aspergillus aculeatinus CBS 121060]|uniref:Uncharacterized protein n=1 Tax=Aspergillus aculeatinus CBS 121060 TaxID=1448322 RepID=A0ACD1GWH9_9EURO|nr:hypothetical protein BO66DRAFT_442807 [Aspergillus aculeatinus CBS 121060]RAH65694.1 hypothetical protein BO66DRAFT_442807 [Aspergillus aculeatinus CBS 121060]
MLSSDIYGAPSYDSDVTAPSEALSETNLDMETKPTLMCAPYLLASAPKDGEHIMWARVECGAQSLPTLSWKIEQSNVLLSRHLRRIYRTTDVKQRESYYGKLRRAQIHLQVPLAGTPSPDDALFPALRIHGWEHRCWSDIQRDRP